jgi:hypothetical protein
MGVPGNANALLLKQAAAAAGGYEISRSVRLNAPDSAYLSRTPGSLGNRRTWTWAGWVKRSKLSPSGYQYLFAAATSTPWFGLILSSDSTNNRLQVAFTAGVSPGSDTIAEFRDVSAWYHVVLAVDTTQATPANRLKLYVNNNETTFSTANYPAQNFDTQVNSTVLHTIGRSSQGANSYLDGYLADIHFIDGQALDPTSFGEFDTNGVWQPIDASGLTFGTNGFHLPFSDNSTAAALGTDTSSNGNTWTVNNISVTAGAGNDSLRDSPTNGSQTDTGVGGEVVGNYCTWNPLVRRNNVTSNLPTFSNGNLDLSVPVGSPSDRANVIQGTIGISSGKWYFEVLITAIGSHFTVGICDYGITNDIYTYFYAYVTDARKWVAGSTSSFGSSSTTNDVVGVAFDLDSGTLEIFKNGSSLGTVSSSLPSGITYFPTIFAPVGLATITCSTNFGQRPFAYTAPSGFKALCTTNLPEPTIADGSTAMDVALYTGNGSTQTISGLNFSPDFVWTKLRGPETDYGHRLADIVRGTGKVLYSNNTSPEASETGITAFNSDGYDLGSAAGLNKASSSFVAWTWDAGSSTVTNTDGSISSGSQVRANPSSGFSVVTWVGDGTGTTRTVGHGLGVAPSLIIAKNRTSADGWPVYHKDLGNSQIVYLNTTAAASTNTAVWNSTSPTSTVFSIGGTGLINELNYNYVAYCFAPVSGYSSFGSYTGNGSADGPFVYTGMRPRWILIKNTSATGYWILKDTARDPANTMAYHLAPNASDADYYDLSLLALDSLSNGFKVRNSNSGHNTNGNVYVFIAFAESPFQYARAR